MYLVVACQGALKDMSVVWHRASRMKRANAKSAWGLRLPFSIPENLGVMRARLCRGLGAPVGACVRHCGIWSVDGARASVVQVEGPGRGGVVAPGGVS